MSRPIHCLSTSQSDVFLLNSRPGFFTVTFQTPRAGASSSRYPICRSYGARLPSSLRRVISSTLPYSGYLPVSDYGTSGYTTHKRVFLGSMESTTSLQPSYQIIVASQIGFTQPYRLKTETSNTPLAYPPASPLLLTCITGSGILTGHPSTTPFGLVLGSTNPGWINLPQETLDFRRYGFSP